MTDYNETEDNYFNNYNNNDNINISNKKNLKKLLIDQIFYIKHSAFIYETSKSMS